MTHSDLADSVGETKNGLEYGSIVEEGESAQDRDGYSKEALKRLTRKHIDNLRPNSMKKPVSASKIFK